MATSPRPGVIQLDHPNVYMAAKEAQKDDWIRRGINLAGDFFQERDRDIRYRRAAGKKDDRNTTKDSLKKLGESAWGLLKAPFTDEAPMAPTTTEDYRTEVGEKKTSPLAETPTDIIDSPEQILNAPKTVTEVDGLPSTQTAEPGVKVSFPMTVAGTVERSKLPDTVVPKPTAQAQGATSPTAPSNVLQAPNYSEMYRIDPERAKFDYGRAQNEAVLAQKEEAAQAKMELMQAKMEAKANTATSLDELQQLWKDNQRGLVQARKDQDKTSVAMYQGNIGRLLPILQEKAPAVWGNPPAKKAGEQPPSDGADGSQTPDEVPTPKQSALTEAYAKVDMLVDKDKNGTVDNLVAVVRAIKAIRDKYGVSDSDMQDVYNQIDLVKGQFSEEAENIRRKKQDDLDNRLKIQAAANTGGAIDARMAQTKIDALAKDPSSQPARSDAVLWIMRKNSGAMIGPNEILQYMQGKLPADKYAELTEKLSPTGMKALLGLVTNKLNDAQITKITADYIPYLQVDGILTDLGVYTNSKTPPPSGGGDTYPKYKTLNSGKKYRKKTANSAWEPVK